MASGKRVPRRLGAWICSVDESGITLRPGTARTRAPRGQTPIVRVAGRGGRKRSVAAIAAYQPGERSRLLHRLMTHRGRKGEPKGFGEVHFAALLDAAHRQLAGPIVLVWDGRATGTQLHQDARADRYPAWLRVYQLPGYARELNPTGNIRSSLKRGMANFAAGNINDLHRIAGNDSRAGNTSQPSPTASSPPPASPRPDETETLTPNGQ